MNTNDRYLNVQYGTLTAEVDITGISRLGGVKTAIKAILSNALSQVDAPQLQLYTNSNRDQLITDLDDITLEKTPQYYQKLIQGGSCVSIGTSSPPSLQPTQVQLFTHIQSSPAISNFWNSFQACTTPIEENQVIQLPTNIYILGNPALGSSVFIRHCYPKLLATALSIIETPDSPHLVILGNLGIGKTYFGYVLLLHLARSGATVVYESGKAEKQYLFSADGISHGKRGDFTNYLDEASTFYIVDASKPVDVAAKTILLSSPRRDVWYKFSDDHCDIRYMPIWSYEEIELCRGALFDDLSSAQVECLYGKWGGIPRYVLEYADNPFQQSKLDSAIKAVDLDLLVKAIGNLEASDSATHRLLHLNVADDFCTIQYFLASEYVADQVYLQLYTRQCDELIQFLSISQGVGDVGVLRDVLFERHAHAVISNGGAFQIRELLDPNFNNSPTLMLQFLASRQLVFDSDSEVQSSEGYYYRPRINNYESVDSFQKPNLLFQMTGTRKHPCKQVGIHKVLNLLGNPVSPILYFVVPKDRFSDFKYQKYEDSSGNIMQQPSYANVKNIRQFVLAIELTRS
ncbi:hypothetical protein BC833DRAFT_531060 [Globomyces pollinis-pini]|nr:hypothetical protein BC833DRAFT_531060 [Globomyces pollinis-pini]